MKHKVTCVIVQALSWNTDQSTSIFINIHTIVYRYTAEISQMFLMIKGVVAAEKSIFLVSAGIMDGNHLPLLSRHANIVWKLPGPSHFWVITLSGRCFSVCVVFLCFLSMKNPENIS